MRLVIGVDIPEEEYIWVVTYYDFNTEPIITVFDNEEAANICYKH